VIAPLRLDEGLDVTCVSDTFKALTCNILVELRGLEPLA
jgi:hypothetical protein